MIKMLATFSVLLLLLAAPAPAKTGPQIMVIDTPDFDAGSIMENSISSVKHVFKVKNTGDSTLTIKEIKPG